MTPPSRSTLPAPSPPAAPVNPLPLPTIAAKRTGWLAGVIVLVVLLVLYLALAYGMVLGNVTAVVAAIAALVPLAAVVAVVRRVDRWEPEPPRLLVFAVLWGAIGSILLTDLYLWLFGTPDRYVAVVIQAPVLEEITKGIGVFLLFLFARRYFDGPVDGLVYGGLIGAGFAFTENIQYFSRAIFEGGFEGLALLFLLRGVMSPFVHVIATGLTGLALGLAASRGLGRGMSVVWGLVGLVAAMGFHALWNSMPGLTEGFFIAYVLLQVPIFALFVGGVIFLLRREQRLTAQRLTEYADVGWFTPQEVTMFSTPSGRAGALRWAATQPGDRRPAMRRLIQAATGLAFARQRAVVGRDPLAASVDEPALLQAVVAARAEVQRPA